MNSLVVNFSNVENNCNSLIFAFSALTLMVGHQEEHLACKELE